MKAAAILFALSLLTAGAESPRPREPWRRVELVGFVTHRNEFQLFGEGEKEFSFATRWDGGGQTHRLAFASAADYADAERLQTTLVELRAVEVRRGREEWLLVESITERK